MLFLKYYISLCHILFLLFYKYFRLNILSFEEIQKLSWHFLKS